MAESSQKLRPLSQVLDEIAGHQQAQITVGELTQKFGGRALGALLFVFGLASID